MTAVELRELARMDPGIARALNHIADQLEAEAADIEARIGRGFSKPRGELGFERSVTERRRSPPVGAADLYNLNRLSLGTVRR
jgi:hypothetical protein